MKVCVLQPDYSPSQVDYRLYDPPRDLAPLLPEHQVDHVALNKLTTFRQMKDLARQGYDIFVNLCEGYPDWDVPSVDVIHAFEQLNLPYTGPPPYLYDVPKKVMKYVAYSAGVGTPAHVLVRSAADVKDIERRLRFPLFVKPAHAGDSRGIDEHSLIREPAELAPRVDQLLVEFPELLVEEYIDGREFTVLVNASPEGNGHCTAYNPVEYIFPPGPHFKTYAMKTSELHPSANIPVRDPQLVERLTDAARRVFKTFEGVGYARMDFRMNDAGELFFLEINFTCSVFYRDGYEGSADYILMHDGTGQAEFARRIIAEGIARHRRKQKRYVMQGNAVSGYGIFATCPLAPGDVVFPGEKRAYRIVTRHHVEKAWNEHDRMLFHRYAYPLSDEVYAVWDEDPVEWAPQNHSCEPNTAFSGLDIVALRPIAQGEELTLDYAQLLNDQAEPFQCQCGTPSCRGLVRGAPGNSVTARAGKR